MRVAVSGYFDPIHVGHIEYLEMARKLVDSRALAGASLWGELIVIVNNDYQCELKKGKSFMPEQDRLKIVQSLRIVDKVFLSIDRDRSVCESLAAVRPDIFANGGDRSLGEIPETKIMKKYNIEMVDGLGDKIRSSSELTGLQEIDKKST
tara:strand:- start:104 stop:553 length:450 start_codon:yes stop_codon:yes gene_type:complete